MHSKHLPVIVAQEFPELPENGSGKKQEISGMFKKYISILSFMAVCLLPVQASSGDLGNVANALENLADMSRSFDDANEAMKDAIKGNPGRYYRDYDRHYYYDDDDDDYYEERRKHAKRAWKARKKREKAWRKWHVDHYRGPRHRPGFPPPPGPHFW